MSPFPVPPDDERWIHPLPENMPIVRVVMQYGGVLIGLLIAQQPDSVLLLIDGERRWTDQYQSVTKI